MPAIMVIKTSHLTAHESAARIIQIKHSLETMDGLKDAVSYAIAGKPYALLDNIRRRASMDEVVALFTQSIMQPDMWTWCDKELSHTTILKQI